MISDLSSLTEKLCQELAQSEDFACVHPAREARRLGHTPPAHALRAISAHACELRPMLDAMCVMRRQRRTRMGHMVGELFSMLRHSVLDRLLDTERSYRATLLELRHGLDVARMLREVAVRREQVGLIQFCDKWLCERSVLLDDADAALSWFAQEPQTALTSGLRLGLRPAQLRAP